MRKQKRKFIVVSRMVIDGIVMQEGDVVTLDYNDPQTRGWVRAGNLRLVAKKKGK